MQMLLWPTLISVLMIQRSAARMLVEQCGMPKDSKDYGPRIMHGNDAEKEAAAWMAAISNEVEFQCGGTVIHRDFVLTAAHCIDGQIKLFVKLGAHNLSNPVQERNVSFALMHHDYKKHQTMDHDIGLLKLLTSIEFGRHVYPICIDLDPLMKSKVNNMDSFNAYGWGTTRTNRNSEILQTISLNRLDRGQCNDMLYKNNNNNNNNLNLTSNQLCVGSWNGDSCTGDSGGPLAGNLTIGVEKIPIQLAIVSFGRRRCDGVGIYTDVSSYANWIEWNVNEYKEYTPEHKNPEVPRPNQGDQYRPPHGFGPNRPLPRFPTRRRPMFLYDQCGGDDLSRNLLVEIYGDGFQGKGVMITNQFVLTNAKGLPSNANADTLEVLITEENSFNELKVISIFKHPDFSGDFHHDIALLKLKRPPLLLGTRKPICMLLKTRNLDPTEGFLTGIYYVDSRKCSDRTNREIKLDQLCIEESEETEKYGIVGKNVEYRGKNFYFLFGIVSYSSNGFIILTDVTKYTEWIDGIVRSHTV